MGEPGEPGRDGAPAPYGVKGKLMNIVFML